MIIRRSLEKNYTKIPNTLDDYLNDPGLSTRAKGILTQLLSKPDIWEVNVKYLVSTNKEGETAIRSTVNELISSGYIHREVVRDQHGRIRGTQHIIFDRRVTPKEAKALLSLQGEPSLEAAGSRCSNVDSRVSKVCSDVGRPPAKVHSPDLSSVTTMEAARPMEEDLHPVNSMVKTQVGDTRDQPDNRIGANPNGSLAPVVNIKDINNPGGVTTTTPGRGVDMGVQEPAPSPSSFPATEQEIKSLIELVPEHHRKPTVERLVRDALGHHEHHQVKEAVVYAADNVRGGWLQFQAYLDKALQNGWAVGYLDHQADPAAAWVDTGAMVPSVLNQEGRVRAKFANGSITGNHRMDDNYRAGLEFMMMMGVEV